MEKLKLNEWYIVSETYSGCFGATPEKFIAFIGKDRSGAIMETESGSRRSYKLRDWTFRHVDDVGLALSRIGLSGVAMTSQREVVQKMLEAGYKI